MTQHSETGLIAGFPAEKWTAFTSPIVPAMIKKDQNGQTYVKHQVCTDALNRCFGPAGWSFEVKQVWASEPYTYTVTKDSKPIQKDGRFYAEALVRLTIGTNGEAAYRENIGAQVAGGSWDEARKGAVSEALKRAASLFGWAPNIYQTDQLSDEWVGEEIMREKQRTDSAGFALPEHYETSLAEWMTTLGMGVDQQQKVLEQLDSRAAAWGVASALQALLANAAPKPKAKAGDATDGKLPV